VKVATWNVNSLRVRLGQVVNWLASAQPDVLALQETKLRDEDFPRAEFERLGYHAAFAGQPAYNGVALLSRAPLSDVRTAIEGLDEAERRVIGGTLGSLSVLNLYVPNGQRVDSEKYCYKLEWLASLHAHLRAALARSERLIVVGDFNIAPGDADVHDPQAWEGKVLCSAPERAALESILALGLTDTFRLFDQPERAYSWWDYRSGAFRRNLGLRIDLILAGEVLSKTCRSCIIDKVPRGWDRPSDHAPVVAEFECR
jgi:exodeoxyribonuclease III